MEIIGLSPYTTHVAIEYCDVEWTLINLNSWGPEGVQISERYEYNYPDMNLQRSRKLIFVMLLHYVLFSKSKYCP